MGLVRRFEDLEVWREARRLTARVYQVVAGGPAARDFALSEQIRRASISTMNNIAEGFDSGSRLECARFVRYAARSASEVQSCLYVALDQAYVDRATFDEIYAQAQSVRRLCAGLRRRLAITSNQRRDGTGHVREQHPHYDGIPAYRRTGAPAHRERICP